MLNTHQRLGEFEIIRLLGKGGMGEVYEAQQDRPHRRVALKVLAPWLAENEQFLKRFWREAEIPAQFDHPGIVHIISTGQTDGIAYYTMNLVQGVSLADMIRQTRDVHSETTTCPERAEKTPSFDSSLGSPGAECPPLPLPEHSSPLLRSYKADRFGTVARIGVMVAKALGYAHGRGCIHRDLKPANIMVDQHDQAYVLDFGLTLALEPDGVNSQPGIVLGTPWYMSPEQARGDGIDHRSDIYSLGVTLYELVTQGNGPYAGSRDEPSAVLSQVRAGQYLPLRSQVPDIPPALESVILKAMSCRANRRYADAGQMARDLERFLEQPSPSRVRPSPAPRWVKKRTLVASVLALLLLVSMAVAFWPSSKPGKKDDDPSKPAPEAKAIEWPADYPEQLRERPWGIPQALFTVEHKPVWERHLAGNGQYRRDQFVLMLGTRPLDDNPTLLALDDDLARRWFEFEVEVNTLLEGPGTNRIGLFFGWRKDSSRFFVVEIDEHPVGPFQHGVARIGILHLIKKGGAEAAVNEFRWLPGDRGQIPLLKSKAWHQLAVRVLDDAVTITVDGARTVPFTTDWLAHAERDIADSLNPRGAIGVWTWNGFFGSFQKPFVTVLKGEKRK